MDAVIALFTSEDWSYALPGLVASASSLLAVLVQLFKLKRISDRPLFEDWSAMITRLEASIDVARRLEKGQKTGN